MRLCRRPHKDIFAWGSPCSSGLAWGRLHIPSKKAFFCIHNCCCCCCIHGKNSHEPVTGYKQTEAHSQSNQLVCKPFSTRVGCHPTTATPAESTPAALRPIRYGVCGSTPALPLSCSRANEATGPTELALERGICQMQIRLLQLGRANPEHWTPLARCKERWSGEWHR